MRDRPLIRVGAVVLAVVVVATAAAGLSGSDPATASDGGLGSGSGSGIGAGEGNGSGIDLSDRSVSSSPTSGSIQPVLLVLLVLVGLFVVTIARPWQIDWRTFLRNLVETLRALSGLAVVLALFVGLVYVLFLAAEPPTQEGGLNQSEPARPSTNGSSADVFSGGGEGTGAGGLDPSLVILAIGGVLAGAFVLAYLTRSVGSSDREATDAADPDRRGSTSARAALDQSFSDVDPTNPVYEAWREMATSVDLSGLETLTTAEVASRAVEQGFDRAAVRRLTAAFEEVRYGERPATEDRVSRARSALERLSTDGRGDS